MSFKPAGRGLTRSAVARQLGVSVATVRRMETRQELTPTIGRGNVRFFDEAAVQALPVRKKRKTKNAVDTRTEGEIAALVFGLFRLNYELGTIVEHVKIPPQKVLELFRYWQGGLSAAVGGAR